ncbi:MAG: extensin family protein [Pseudomonadota bacterium]|nr:extensin family protein [Pseudomonadota bacterium]
MREHPERFPWTELRLNDPVGPFTGIKLAALGDERRRCLALLRDARLAEIPFEQPAPADRRCRFNDGVRIGPESRRSIDFSPEGLVTACPVAAALALWERDVVQPAARRHFGDRVVRIDHAGSYSCRRLYGRAEGRFSEHATADAIDILGFRLANGRRLSVLRDWRGEPADEAFLRDVRDGACDLFATVLSPDYNAAHADHFHLDQADRGALGWRLCR